MNTIHGERGNVVFSVRGCKQRMIIDHLDALLRRILGYPLIELIDARKPLRARIRFFRQGSGPHGGMVPITTAM